MRWHKRWKWIDVTFGADVHYWELGFQFILHIGHKRSAVYHPYYVGVRLQFLCFTLGLWVSPQ